MLLFVKCTLIILFPSLCLSWALQWCCPNFFSLPYNTPISLSSCRQGGQPNHGPLELDSTWLVSPDRNPEKCHSRSWQWKPPDAAEGHCQTSQWLSLTRLPGQGQSALLQCSVPLDQLLAQLAEGLPCPPACYSSLISSKPLASISTLNDLINLYNRKMMSSLHIGTGSFGGPAP